MFNKIILMGRITHDLELKTTPNGVSVCTFRVAVDRRFRNSENEKQTDFFNVVAWRQQAEFIAKYFAKGRMVLVEGEMQTRPYTDKNGNPATWYEIIADRLSFTGESKGKNDTVPQGTPPVPTPPEIESAADSDDDYPF